MGRPKLLLPFNGSTIIETVVGQALRSSAKHVLVVLGAYKDEIIKQIGDQKVTAVDNPDFHEGMLSSVRAGLRNLPPDTGAVMIMLADQPMISHEVINQLTDAYRHSPMDIAIAVHRGKSGHPLLFNVKYREEILQLPREANLHEFLNNHPGGILKVETGTPDILRDIDTIDDYKNILNYRR
jgi:molybdenum cofactor cytidylyltransferase